MFKNKVMCSVLRLVVWGCDSVTQPKGPKWSKYFSCKTDKTQVLVQLPYETWPSGSSQSVTVTGLDHLKLKTGQSNSKIQQILQDWAIPICLVQEKWKSVSSFKTRWVRLDSHSGQRVKQWWTASCWSCPLLLLLG